MPTSRSILTGLLLGISCHGATLGAEPDVDDPPETDTSLRLREFRKHARQAAGRYEIWLGSERDRTLQLLEAPILQWTNPVGGRDAQGEIFLWTDRGRAEAIVSIYKMLDYSKSYYYEDREFCSLAKGPLVAETSDHAAWKPTEPGIVWRRLSDVPTPRNSRPLRLRQMRLLAAQFTVDKTTREGVVRELRLLPQPLYRYHGDHPDVVDAALFTFVEGTDAEALLLLEARPGDDRPGWHYAFAPMNSILLRGYRHDAPVWEAPRHDVAVKDGTYTVIRVE